jgi:5-formyltetrahydrofolate cyclo-ligase
LNEKPKVCDGASENNMDKAVSELKGTVRREVRERGRTLSEGDLREGSEHARALLVKQKVWEGAESILFFAPMSDELDIWPLVGRALQEGRLAALPRFDVVEKKYRACRLHDVNADVQVGSFGIREPVAGCSGDILKQLDLILVPGIAFDLRGGRLGRGRGYYDRLLSEVSGATCAVAFDYQIVETVPAEPHDIHLDYILTPTRWLQVTRESKMTAEPS